MTPEEEIKERGIQRGADQVGIASVAVINKHAPPDHRPDDILIGAKSVIVFAGHLTPRGAWRSPDHRTSYSNQIAWGILPGIARALTEFIESQYGYYTLADIPASIGLNPSLSQKLCAEMSPAAT